MRHIGDIEVTGSIYSNIVETPIVSNTASFNMDSGTVFRLPTFTGSVDTSIRFEAQNIKAGAVGYILQTKEGPSGSNTIPTIKEFAADNIVTRWNSLEFGDNNIESGTYIWQYFTDENVMYIDKASVASNYWAPENYFD